MSGKPLENPRWEAFAREIVQGTACPDAYLKAGYKPGKNYAKRARELKNRPEIQQRCADLRQIGSDLLDMELAQWLHYQVGIARGNMLDLFERDDAGNLLLRDLKDLPIEKQMLVKELTMETVTLSGYDDQAGEGERVIGQKLKLKMYDRQKALDSIGRFLGAFEKDNIQRRDAHFHEHAPANGSSDEDLDDRRQKLLERLTGG